MRRPRAAGVAIVVAYVAVSVATIGLSGRHVRPLFEGIGPSSPYRWVKPPPLFAPGNVSPAAISTDVALSALDAAFQVSTGDGQVSVNVPAHGVAAPAGVTTVKVSITPGDPAKLGPLPAGLRPAGNAYEVTLTYQPSGSGTGPLAKDGNITLVLPEPARSIAYSPDGRTWQQLPAQAIGSVTTVGTSFHAGGWYLGTADAASAAPGALTGRPASSKRLSTLVVVALAVGLTAALVGVPTLLRRRRSPAVQRGTRRARRSR